jgi:acyl carrier protein
VGEATISKPIRWRQGGHTMTDEDILERLTDVFRYVFDYEGEGLTTAMTSDDIAAWDSMSNITLAIEVENSFHIKIKMAEMERMKNVKDLVALVKTSLPLSTP